MGTYLIMKKIENKDYEIIPSSSENDMWDIRILDGIFVETIIRFGTVSLNEDHGHLNFKFDVIFSPDDDITSENTELQLEAANILESVIETGIEEGFVEMREK